MKNAQVPLSFLDAKVQILNKSARNTHQKFNNCFSVEKGTGKVNSFMHGMNSMNNLYSKKCNGYGKQVLVSDITMLL